MTNELSTEFKYDLVDQSTAEFLKQKEFNMREIVGNAYTELGKRTERSTRPCLSKHGYGCFCRVGQSLVSIKMMRDSVRRLIKRYEMIIANSESNKIYSKTYLYL
nr:hypothetical protein [Bacillus velezensis]